MEGIVAEAYRKLGNSRTCQFLDDLKEIGFEFATKAGITVGIDDIVIPQEKQRKIEEANSLVEQIQNQYKKGVITDGERYNKIIDIWTHATSDISEVMFERLSETDFGFNPLFMMADSGARGSKEQIRQLAGMRGLMAKPQKKIVGQVGEIIETPITSNFREGLSVLEYFISTHGARKGLADTALKTADAGYLTRRLVDVSQDVIITEFNCGTILGLNIGALKEGEEVIEPLQDRILGRVALEDVEDPITGEILTPAGDEIDEAAAARIADSGVEKVKIRSVLTCEARHGVCGKCYGRNLANGKMVNMGEAVGVMAAQSIGEPGTQLTLRTFHIGGTASRIAEQSQIKAKISGVVYYHNVKAVRRGDGKDVVIDRSGEVHLKDDKNRIRARYTVPYGAVLQVADETEVKRGDIIFEWDPYSNVILSHKKGIVEFVEIKEGITVREETDVATGLRQRVICEDREKALNPHIHIVDKRGRKIGHYSTPVRAYLLVHNGDRVKAGDMLAKIPREITKTRDITGGLPRVAELFEARKPKEPAVVSEIDGTVKFGKMVRGSREIIVVGENDQRTYLVPYGKHLHVHDDDIVFAGERLSEGSINPHDILRIKGVNEVQEYLVNEIQEVYRLQGVRINDKHIEVIVRQMLQKVRVEDPGDTTFLEGELVDKFRFQEENEKVIAEGGEPATFQPLLLGITKASLLTESFVSAASFQETTRVLTEAAIHGKRDPLLGLKENVIIGHLIPAGTGLERYSRERLKSEEDLKTEEESVAHAAN